MTSGICEKPTSMTSGISETVLERPPPPKDRKHLRDWRAYGYMTPTITCPFEEKIGGMGDGGKWLCLPRILLQSSDCVVYSFGSKGDFSFEYDILRVNPQCRIHTFDPTPGLAKQIPRKKLPKQITFHPFGISGAGISKISIRDQMVEVKTLDEIASLLGHKVIHVLKVDVEGSETSPNFVNRSLSSVWRNVAQLQMEFHRPKNSWDLLSDISSVGLEEFHRELNFFCKICAELAFINPHVTKFLEANLPYTEEKRTTSLTRISKALHAFRMKLQGAKSRKAKHPLMLALPFHMGCPHKAFLSPSDRSHQICEPYFRESERQLVYVFEDFLSWNQISYTRGFLEYYPEAQVRVWLPESKMPGPSQFSFFLSFILKKNSLSF